MNQIILIGYIGKDAEEGDGFLNFPLATTERWTDKETGDKREHTDWHRIGTRNVFLKKYLVKGKQVAVQGTLRMDVKEGPDGQKRKYANVVAFRVELLGSAPPFGQEPKGGTPDSDVPFFSEEKHG